MNLLMICFTIWCWGTSFTQMMIMKPTKISNRKVLMTIKTHTITACWLECQQTNGCETIGTDSDNEKISDLTFECYIFGSGENKPESSNEIPLKATEISPFTVSYFELNYSIICSCFFHCFLFFRSFFMKLFNRDLNQGCLVYMFPLSFSGSKFFEATCYSFPQIS